MHIKFPHTFITLFGFVLLACILTYIIPAGEFQREFDTITEQTVVIAESYHQIENTPITPLHIFHKFYESICQTKTASLMFFILLIGGAFEIILKTGSVHALCEVLLSCLGNKELLAIPLFVSLFSILGFTMGLTTASIVFVPIGITIASIIGIPKICGMAMISLGINVGFLAGVFNPFSVGVAQMIAEVPLYSGIAFRWIILILFNGITSSYIMWYASRNRQEKLKQEIRRKYLTWNQKIILLEFVSAFGILIYGISMKSWSTTEILITFLSIRILMGITNRLTGAEICETFLIGCKKMLKGVLKIGRAHV